MSTAATRAELFALHRQLNDALRQYLHETEPEDLSAAMVDAAIRFLRANKIEVDSAPSSVKRAVKQLSDADYGFDPEQEAEKVVRI